MYGSVQPGMACVVQLQGMQAARCCGASGCAGKGLRAGMGHAVVRGGRLERRRRMRLWRWFTREALRPERGLTRW